MTAVYITILALAISNLGTFIWVLSTRHKIQEIESELKEWMGKHERSITMLCMRYDELIITTRRLEEIVARLQDECK